eukprot:2111410-Amphidinium_carterae.1
MVESRCASCPCVYPPSGCPWAAKCFLDPDDCTGSSGCCIVGRETICCCDFLSPSRVYPGVGIIPPTHWWTSATLAGWKWSPHNFAPDDASDHFLWYRGSGYAQNWYDYRHHTLHHAQACQLV